MNLECKQGGLPKFLHCDTKSLTNNIDMLLWNLYITNITSESQAIRLSAQFIYLLLQISRVGLICPFVTVFIHSFKYLYSTSSRELLRGAPDSSTVKKNSFQALIECVREWSREQAQLKRKAIPYRRAHHIKNTTLHDRRTGKGNWSPPSPLSVWSEYSEYPTEADKGQVYR